MRISASAVARWAAVLAAVYLASLGLWRLFEPIYMHALAAGVAALNALNLFPTAIQAVVAPRLGLAIVGTGFDAFPVPQRIIGADLALAAALVMATPWLPWKERTFKLWLAALGVFTAHLGTILIQVWMTTGSSSGASAAWNLWSTLYQGKIVPILAWCLVAVPPLVVDITSHRPPSVRRQSASRSPT